MRRLRKRPVLLEGVSPHTHCSYHDVDRGSEQGMPKGGTEDAQGDVQAQPAPIRSSACANPRDAKAARFQQQARPTIAEYGIRALDLSIDPTRTLRDIVLVLLKPRPDSKKAETAFIATSVSVAPVDVFGAKQGEELRGQLKNFDTEQKRIGMRGGIMVMLLDTESGATNVCPVRFGADIMEHKPGWPWKEEMMTRMNTGIVC